MPIVIDQWPSALGEANQESIMVIDRERAISLIAWWVPSPPPSDRRFVFAHLVHEECQINLGSVGIRGTTIPDEILEPPKICSSLPTDLLIVLCRLFVDFLVKTNSVEDFSFALFYYSSIIPWLKYSSIIHEYATLPLSQLNKNSRRCGAATVSVVFLLRNYYCSCKWTPVSFILYGKN